MTGSKFRRELVLRYCLTVPIWRDAGPAAREGDELATLIVNGNDYPAGHHAAAGVVADAKVRNGLGGEAALDGEVLVCRVALRKPGCVVAYWLIDRCVFVWLGWRGALPCPIFFPLIVPAVVGAADGFFGGRLDRLLLRFLLCGLARLLPLMLRRSATGSLNLEPFRNKACRFPIVGQVVSGVDALFEAHQVKNAARDATAEAAIRLHERVDVARGFAVFMERAADFELLFVRVLLR